MTAPSRIVAHSHADFGVSWAAAQVKRILNHLRERADAATDRTRFAALPPRALADVGVDSRRARCNPRLRGAGARPLALWSSTGFEGLCARAHKIIEATGAYSPP